MTDVADNQIQDVESVLASHPGGIEYDKLYMKTSRFSDRQSLSMALHRLRQLERVYKVGPLYFLTSNKGADPQADTEAGESKAVQPKPQATVSKPEAQPVVNLPTDAEGPVAKSPMGDLHKSAGMAGAAMALYKLRDLPFLTLDNIVELTGGNRLTLQGALAKLVDRRYARKDSTNSKHPKFKWSGEYSYPFKYAQPSDDLFLKVDLKEYRSRYANGSAVQAQVEHESVEKQLVVQRVKASKIVESPSTVACEVAHTQLILALIESQLETYESQLNSILLAKANLLQLRQKVNTGRT